MNSNTTADEPYAPEPGDIDWNVIAFLKENPDEELTAIDVGIKFDVDTDLVAEKLRRATVHEYLRKTRNRQNALVWRLGSRPLRVSGDLVAAQPARPTPANERYVNRVSLPAINRKTPLMDEATRQRNEINEWLKGFEPGDSATFNEADRPMDDMRKDVAKFRKEEPTYYFSFVVTGAGQWGMERRDGPPPTGRKKGAPVPAKKKAARA